MALWADRTTPKTATRHTPFSLVYGAEAVILAEIRIPTHRYGCNTQDENDAKPVRSLDTIEELRDAARIRMAAQNIRVRTFQVGDLVLRKTFQNTQNPSAGKFAFNWEGPYQIESIVDNGAYRLITLEGDFVPRSWNAIHHRRYYI
ncbi:hypothetical protein vseg_007301 [Gypsophila vaccaria]